MEIHELVTQLQIHLLHNDLELHQQWPGRKADARLYCMLLCYYGCAQPPLRLEAASFRICRICTMQTDRLHFIQRVLVQLIDASTALLGPFCSLS